MKAGGAAFGVALTAAATIASAAVTESQFPTRTVRDLIEICAPAKEDPMMTAAMRFVAAGWLALGADGILAGLGA